MKKWIIVACSLFVLFLISAYSIIPKKILLTKSITANANQTGVYRFLTDESNWQKWWPGSSYIDEGARAVLESGGYLFKRTKLLYNSFEISIQKGKDIHNSLLVIFSPDKDSIKIEWSTTINTGANPFSKVSRYFKAQKLSSRLGDILIALQKHVSNVKNIYEIDIKKEKVKIEFLVTTKKSFAHYPTTGEIYEMINQIKTHISREQAKENDYPMFHIKVYDSTHFEAQVAIPVDRKLEESDGFSIKRMLKNGDILAAEIKGGKSKTDSAMKLIDKYASDHQYHNIAIPFHSLVTDRMMETDSAKWITRLYYPIM